MAAANVRPLDDPYEKQRALEQMQYMKRIPKAALASMLSSWVYFGYSLKCILDAQAGGLTGTALKAAWLSFAIQLGHASEFFRSSLYVFPGLSDPFTVPPGTPHLLALSAMGKEKRQPLLRLVGDECPTVDVFITYCGEEVDVLMDTVRAATALDYPIDRYRVIVLDDSVSAKIKAEIEKLGSQTQNVYYTTRGTKPKTHTKAGNLNYGLKYSSALSGGASELVAVLDVDMMPSRHWLRALVPHILAEPKVALVNPPQRHYNIPDGDPLGQTMDILFEVMEPLKNATNAAWCCGTGFVLRRDALDGIGGVPEESINEDIMTSTYLTAAGWKIVYVPEDVQWGLVPNTITSHLKQQKRTCAGIISTAAVLWSPQAQSMTPEQLYGALFMSVAYAMSIIITMMDIVLLPVAIFIGAPLVVYSTETQLRRLSLLFLIKFLSIFSYDFLATKAANYHLSLLGVSNAWLVPYQFWTIVRFALSILTGGGVPLFTPSGLTDLRTAKTFARRLKVALWDDGFILHVIIIASIIGGVVSSANAASEAVNIWSAVKHLFVRAAWPPVFLMWSTYITDCWIPLSYAFQPPEPLTRKSLVEHDPATQLAQPTRHAKDQVRVRPSQWLVIAKIAYCIGACLVSMYCM
ncbi:MAG: hypothetical protein Q9191_008150 [Dirinaria sp. TL-2023a]